MTRATFLQDYWQPFPVAPKGCTEPTRPQAGAWVGGRLTHSENVWSLSAAGSSLELKFSSQSRWIGAGHAEFDLALLDEGDIVAVRADDDFVVNEIQLLVPSRGSYSLAGAFTNERADRWAKFVGTTRAFFNSRGFTDALTPTLVPSPGTEPFLDPFLTEWHLGSTRRTFFLPTSPEFHLKKMLVAGWTRLYEIRNCFRNGEISEHHQPEFSMLEWYRAYSDLDAIADDVEALLAAHGAPALERTTMAELFAKAFAGFELTPQTTREELMTLADRVGTVTDASDTWDEVFFRLFLEHIETRLGDERPLLVRGYPPSQAALSRIGADGFADRFEVYWKGLELANAFHELNDPHENLHRFAQDAEGKRALGKEAVPVDLDLVRALEYGLPPSGGIALGMDRLFMALNGISRIADARAFPVV